LAKRVDDGISNWGKGDGIIVMSLLGNGHCVCPGYIWPCGHRDQ